MNLSFSPTQSNVQTAIKSFLQAVTPGPVGQEPAVFQGSIVGTTLTVSPLPGMAPGGIEGAIALNSPLLGAAPGTTIQSQLTGPTGGAGTYQVSISQVVQLPTTMSTGVTVVAAQPNRVGEPNNPWFIIMTAMFGRRMATNQDTSADVKFTASMAANVMTVSAVQAGAISPGSTVFATGVIANTLIIGQLSGAAGGPGTYSISPGQNVGSRTMSAGAKQMFMSSELTMQLDFHSPDYLAGDLAQTVLIAFRDEFSTSFFEALAPPLNSVSPLYADDPRQAPFVNAENQYEWRWVLDLHAQVDETVSVTAEYADAAVVTLHEVP